MGKVFWPSFSSSLHASENIIKQLHPGRICQENKAREMKCSEGADKQGCSVPAQCEAGGWQQWGQGVLGVGWLCTIINLDPCLSPLGRTTSFFLFLLMIDCSEGAVLVCTVGRLSMCPLPILIHPIHHIHPISSIPSHLIVSHPFTSITSHPIPFHPSHLSHASHPSHPTLSHLYHSSHSSLPVSLRPIHPTLVTV